MSVASSASSALAAPDSVAVADAVAALEGDHDEATAAVYVLQAGGARAAKQIQGAWPRLSPLAQKRAIGALFNLAREQDAAFDTLAEAARSQDQDVRDRAFAALRRSGVRGQEAFVALLDDVEVGDRAAALLARVAPADAIRPLLDSIATGDGSERPGLRAALVTAVQRAEADADTNAVLRAWLGSSPSTPAVASVALGLAGLEPQRALMTSFVEKAVPSAAEFSTTWRLLKSSAAAGPSKALDRFAKEQAAGAEEWMLREAAVDAMTARGLREGARPSLNDPYPRVRASAATALSGDDETMLGRATLARRDTWPMVRAAAVRSLRTEGEALPVVVASVDDSMSLVRAAAIETLSLATHDEGWDRIHRRLRARNEWPQVTEAAIHYVVAHCRSDAAEALFFVVMRAAPANAVTEDLNNAARAIEALRALGSPEALAAVEQLRSTPGVPPTLKMALEEPLSEDVGCSGSAP
ncbi:MAG: HEAT repeat domain-containing protein [Polyangiales bacterium]